MARRAEEQPSDGGTSGDTTRVTAERAAAGVILRRPAPVYRVLAASGFAGGGRPAARAHDVLSALVGLSRRGVEEQLTVGVRVVEVEHVVQRSGDGVEGAADLRQPPVVLD